MRDLHAGGAGVPVDGDRFHTKSLQSDYHLLAQLAASKQHNSRRKAG
jgi:hypothetical protein